MEIKAPHWLQTESGGAVLYGLDQEWYSTPRKRLSGCGPTTASTLLLYVNRRDGGALPYRSQTAEEAKAVMEDVWEYVTPGFMGLHNVEKFARGAEALIRHYGERWRSRVLRVRRQNSPDDALAFVEAGLASDCPVAFLNLHPGDVADTVDGWHWITLTGLEQSEGTAEARACDAGKEIRFDLRKWLATTKIGGGFVYLTK